MDELDLILQQMGIPPEQRRAMLAMILGSPQQPVDPFLAGSEYDVKDANRYLDYGKDFNSLLADNMTGAMTGMDAYGGINELGFQAFDPTVERQEVAAPARGQLDRMLQRPTTDVGGWIADQIVNQGMSAAEVIGVINGLITRDTIEDDPAMAALQTSLKTMIPSFVDPVTQQQRFDMDMVENLASSLEEQSYLMPEPGAQQDPTTGQWYTEKVTPSPQAEWYRERGLPLPTQRYTLEDFTPEGAAYQQQADALGTAYSAQEGMRSALDANSQKAYQNMLRTRELAQQQPQRTPQEAALDYSSIQQYGPDVNIPGMPNAAPQSSIDAMWNQVAARQTAGGTPTPMSTGQQATDPNRATVGQAQPGSYFPPSSNQGIGNEQGMSLFDQVRNMITGGQIAMQNRGQAQQQAADPNASKKAMADYLAASKSAAWSRQPAIDQYKAQQQAMGRRFMEWDPAKKKYVVPPDVGVGQGRLNYAVSQAQGRTPLQDALRARAMAAYLMGG